MKKYLVGILVICGCASYSASGLTSLQTHPVKSKESGETFTVACKAYDRVDCQRFLDRNVLEKGYQPIQIFIQNDTDHVYTFSPQQISLPVIGSDDIARRVHTNTGGRITAYTLGGFLLTPILWIPAVVDGIKSKEANQMLDLDYQVKAAKTVDLQPGESFNSVVFVHRNDYSDQFTATLIQQGTDKTVVIPMVAQ